MELSCLSGAAPAPPEQVGSKSGSGPHPRALRAPPSEASGTGGRLFALVPQISEWPIGQRGMSVGQPNTTCRRRYLPLVNIVQALPMRSISVCGAEASARAVVGSPSTAPSSDELD